MLKVKLEIMEETYCRPNWLKKARSFKFWEKVQKQAQTKPRITRVSENVCEGNHKFSSEINKTIGDYFERKYCNFTIIHNKQHYG